MRLTSKVLLILIFSGFLTVTTQSFSQIGSTKKGLTRDDLLGQINTITTAVPFLLIAPDARAGGMADCGAATSPDANSIHWNPAKYAFADKPMSFAVSYTPWLRALANDIYLAYLA